MLNADQEKLAFLRLELKECESLVSKLKDPDEIEHWKKEAKKLADKVFEMEVLLGVEL